MIYDTQGTQKYGVITYYSVGAVLYFKNLTPFENCLFSLIFSTFSEVTSKILIKANCKKCPDGWFQFVGNAT